MRPAILFAPAKLNLGLKITGRYANGYHHLESLFVPVTLYDRITLMPAVADEVRYAWRFIRETQQLRQLALGTTRHPLIRNSIATARDILRTFVYESQLWKSRATAGHSAETPTDRLLLRNSIATPTAALNSFSSLRITITKQIPSPSGLGGASADAAAIFACLFGISSSRQAAPELLLEASRLGADIPYFLQHGLWGEAAHLSGVGAQLKPVELPQLAGIVAVPSFGFSTAAMFAYFRLRDLPTVTENNPPETIQGKSALRLSEIRHSDERFPGVRVAQNDFEQAAAAVFPKEAQLLSAAQAKIAQAVRQFFPGTWLAGLTGSGPALYAVTECSVSSADLKRLSSVLRHRLGALWQVYPIRSHRP